MSLSGERWLSNPLDFRGMGYANVKWYGAIGNHVDSDDVAFAAAFATGATTIFVPPGDYMFSSPLYPPAGATILGCGASSRLWLNNSTLGVALLSGTALRSLGLSGSTAIGVGVGYGGSLAVKCKILDCDLAGLGINAIELFAAKGVDIVGNCFSGTGYGVLQANGSVSSHVRIVRNQAEDMLGDFVECSCGSTGASVDWLIDGNQYLGGRGYPTPQIERRFVGITGVSGVRIIGNYVQNSCGDAAVHLEQIAGNVSISANHFKDCAGERSYIWPMVSNDMQIVGNTFEQLDVALPAAWVINAADVAVSSELTFSNNVILGNSSRTLSGINFQFRAGLICTGNRFTNIDTVLQLYKSSQGVFSHNKATLCNRGILATSGVAGGWNDGWAVVGNRLLTDGASIEIRRNSNGTGPSKQWMVANNFFGGDAIGFDTVDFSVLGNHLANGKTCDMGQSQYATSAGYNSANNHEVTP